MADNNKKNINKDLQMNKERIYELIRKPIITEKATLLSANNQYVFEVASSATKIEIKTAIEFLFKVVVTKVATINQIGKKKVFRGKAGKRNDFKKAIVTLANKQTIDLSAGV